MDKKISFSEELLSGYLDGELSNQDAQKVQQFALASADLKEDLSSLAKVGEIFRSNFSADSEELNIWQAIEGKLTVKTPIAGDSNMPRKVQVETKAGSKFWNSIFRPSYGAALALGLFAVGMLSSQWVDLPEKNTNKVIAKISESDLPLKSQEILVPLIQKNRAGASQTFVSNGFPAERTNDFNYSPQFISPQQLSAEHPARGNGVRADGMQIEWMKNSKDVRFLRHKNDTLPPMIWLGDLK